MSMRDKIYLQRGNIADCEVEAVIRTAYCDHILGTHLSEDLKEKGGADLTRETNEIGRLQVGEAAVTTGGKLRATWVIHAACKFTDRFVDEGELLTATRNALAEARERGVKTVAIPPLGAGGEHGFSIKRCAELLISEAIKHLEGDTTIEEVYFVCDEDRAYEFFNESLQQI